MKDNFKNCYALYGLFMNNNNKKTEREGKEFMIIFGDF